LLTMNAVLSSFHDLPIMFGNYHLQLDYKRLDTIHGDRDCKASLFFVFVWLVTRLLVTRQRTGTSFGVIHDRCGIVQLGKFFRRKLPVWIVNGFEQDT
jgi:hypothetical protein